MVAFKGWDNKNVQNCVRVRILVLITWFESFRPIFFKSAQHVLVYKYGLIFSGIILYVISRRFFRNPNGTYARYFLSLSNFILYLHGSFVLNRSLVIRGPSYFKISPLIQNERWITHPLDFWRITFLNRGRISAEILRSWIRDYRKRQLATRVLLSSPTEVPDYFLLVPKESSSEDFTKNQILSSQYTHLQRQ